MKKKLSEWTQILIGFTKSKTKKILKISAVYLMWNLEICQDDPNQGPFSGLLNINSTNALSFYRSKMILDSPNCFGRVQVVLVGSKSFWLDTNHFGQVQIRLLWTKFCNLDLSKTIGTRPKWFERYKISKSFWT